MCTILILSLYDKVLVFCRYCGSLQPMPMPAGSGGVALALFVSKELIVPKVRIENRHLQNLVKKELLLRLVHLDTMYTPLEILVTKKHKQR